MRYIGKYTDTHIALRLISVLREKHNGAFLYADPLPLHLCSCISSDIRAFALETLKTSPEIRAGKGVTDAHCNLQI